MTCWQRMHKRNLNNPIPARNYGVEDAAEGKAAAKAALRERVGLSAADAPLVAVVTRLTHQKGIHLIKHAAWRTLERGAQFLLLGSAPDPRVLARAAAHLHLSCFPCSMPPPFRHACMHACSSQRSEPRS